MDGYAGKNLIDYQNSLASAKVQLSQLQQGAGLVAGRLRGPQPPDVERGTEIHNFCGHLDNALESIANLSARLEQELTSVVRPESPPPTLNQGPSKPSGASPLGDRLCGFIVRAETISGILSSIIRRLEL